MCPTTALRAQWADAADRSGCTSTRAGATPTARGADVDGVVVTYQQVASAPTCSPTTSRGRRSWCSTRSITPASRRRWGTALRTAFEERRSRLALSGTPFRSDARAIPFVRYDEDRRCAPDFVYGYGDAVGDGVCRPLAFRLLDATLRWRVDAQETIAAFADELDPTDDARRLRTAIDPTTPLLPRCCATPTRCWSRRAPSSPTLPGSCSATTALTPARPPRCCARSPARSRSSWSATSAGAPPDRPLRPRRRRRAALARGGQHGQRGRRRPAAGARRLRDRQAHRPVLPPGGRRVVRRRADDPTTSSRPSSCPPTRPQGCAERVEVELRQQVSTTSARPSTSSRRRGLPAGQTSRRSTPRSNPAG